MSGGRHSQPDRVGIAMGGVSAVLAAGAMVVLTLIARDPGPAKFSDLAPASVPDAPLSGSPVPDTPHTY